MRLVCIGSAGFAGSVLRHLVGTWIGPRSGTGFPWGTFAVNVSGCFAMGILFAAFARRVPAHPSLAPALMAGFLGAYTTFSTFSVETIRLAETRAIWLAAAYVVGSVAAGLGAVWGGFAVVRAVLSA